MSDFLPLQLDAYESLRPKSLTFITTYKCTAACAECCFECNTKIEGRLGIDFILRTIDEAISTFSSIELAVFTGGECFLLGEDLFTAISHATQRQLRTRCVTNGYWGKKPQLATRYARQLKAAGASEINISTGVDHAEWVPINAVINCAMSLHKERIRTLITVEKDGPDSNILEQIRFHPGIAPLLGDSNLTVASNVWMPFHADTPERLPQGSAHGLDEGCKQLFSNIVVTPHKRHSACCGLTLEHIPEMHLGYVTGESLGSNYSSQFDDFLKLWIHSIGPKKILEKVMGPEASSYLEGVVHTCQACAILHKTEEIRERLISSYQQFVPEVLGGLTLKEKILHRQNLKN